MQYLAICEDDLLFQFMRNVATEQGDVRYLVPTANIAQRIKRQRVKVRHGDLLKEETYKKIKLHHVDQAVVFVRDADEQDRVCRLLRALDKNIPIVSLTSEKNGKKNYERTRRPAVAPLAARRYLRRVLRYSTARHSQYQESRAHPLVVRRRQEDPHPVAT